MIPANTTVTCPSCDTEFEIEYDVQEGEIVDCDNCDVELELVDGDLKTLDEDIYGDDEEDEEEENPQYPVGQEAPRKMK